MKVFITTALLILFIGNIGAVDTESYQFIDHIWSITTPREPEILGDSVLFTAPSSFNRLGISFAHEGYTKVHWFKKFMIPKDAAELAREALEKKKAPHYKDSGIMFHLETIPANIKNMDYRMVIDGLWTTDPYNPRTVSGPSGVVESRIPIPEKPKNSVEPLPPGTYKFCFRAPPGETITVGGSFNNWDPFMYKLREETPGFYTLLLRLPPGSFQYVFFHHGEWVPDPDNPIRRYSRDGRSVSEANL